MNMNDRSVFNGSVDEYLRTTPCLKPSREVIIRRQRLAEYLRSNENRFFTASSSDANSIRHLLGWDDNTLHQFIFTPCMTNSSPHASLNIFAPNFAHPWIHTAIHQLIKKQNAHSIHLRTMLTYNNFGDKTYRPHAWWTRISTKKIQRIPIFSRHQMQSRALLAYPFPTIESTFLNTLDKEALYFASKASSFAYGCIIYRSYLEQHCQLIEPQSKIDIPLDILSKATFQQYDPSQWALAYSSICPQSANEIGVFRIIDQTGRLVFISNNSINHFFTSNISQLDLLIPPNPMSIALIYLLNISAISGGKKMHSYIWDVNKTVKQFLNKLGIEVHIPRFIGMTEVAANEIMPLNEEEQNLLSQQRIEGCFSVGAFDHGRDIRHKLDKLLSAEVKNIFNPSSINL